MDTLLEKLFSVVSDPVVIAVIIAFGITIGVLWRLFTKQHDFIRERLELLRQENQDLRTHIDELRTENERLKSLSGQIQAIVVTLREQSSMSEEVLGQIVAVERKVLPELTSSLTTVSETSQRSAYEISSALKEVSKVIPRLLAGRKEVEELAKLVESIAHASQDSSRRLEEVAHRARQIIDRSCN